MTRLLLPLGSLPLFFFTLLNLTACSSAPLGAGTSSRKLAEAPTEPIAWIELGPSSKVLARVITGAGNCPKVVIDTGGELPMVQRGQPNEAYPVRVCEVEISTGTVRATLEGRELPLPTREPRKILFIGDTGCRIKAHDGMTEAQWCNDPKGWPFPQMVRNEASGAPDLVVHVGDYLYRESPCPAGNAYCAGSPSGQNWESWNADFFDAALPLLRKAPWIFVRGNHELCSRAGEGWFRFLDPRPLEAACSDMTDPYLIKLGQTQFVVHDSALATDVSAPDDQVQGYRRQFETIARMSLDHAWLVTHKPFWAPAFRVRENPNSPLEVFNQTLQKASGNHLPSSIDLVFAGHLHLFEQLNFADGRPTQLVVGNGGTLRTSPPYQDPTGLKFAGTTVASGSTLDDFGYFTYEAQKDGWEVMAHDGEGRPRLLCHGPGHHLVCEPAPTTP